MKNESCISSMLICRKCKLLKWTVYDTHGSSSYKFLCAKCAKEEDIISTCINCGREGVGEELNKFGGYCHKCENDNISECSLCGVETYNSNLIDGVCPKCANGTNKPCNKCGEYFNKNKLSSDSLCPKCSIKLHKTLVDSGVNEVVECLECGRECYVNDLDKGLCIYCKCDSLETEIKRLKKKKKSYGY